jgi:hypothetical protein
VITVAALTAAFLQLSTAVSRRQSHMRDKMQAFYMAEAGLAEAYEAIRVKKTGNIGTEADPAGYGDGLFWVEATDLGNNLVQLECTGMVGTATALLGLVVEKGVDTVADLGVYSPTPIDLPPGTYLDGYDSRLGYGQGGAKTLQTEEELKALYDDFLEQMSGTALGGGSGTTGASAPQRGGTSPDPDPISGSTDPTTSVAPANDFSGRIASGGGITATGTSTQPVVIDGDLVPGPSDGVTLTGDVTVTGETEPAPAAVQLPPIETPTLPALQPIAHSGTSPLLVLPTDAQLPSLVVGQDSEVIVQGPATLVVGTLDLGPNARLYVDTTEGEVQIFVTNQALFAEDAHITNSSEDPSQLSLSIAATAAAPIGLPAGSPIHGVLYAPDATLVAPPGFELFGSLVADSLTFTAPPKLHFDEHLVEVAADLATPRLFSWRIVELENVTGGLASDPFVRLGVDPATLRKPADCHADQPIAITYETNLGGTATYNGSESGFDWTQVKRVRALSRGGEKVMGDEDRGLAPGTLSTSDSDLDPLVDMVADDTKTSTEVKDQLLAASPVSNDALSAAINRSPALTSADLKEVLVANAPLSDGIELEALRMSGMGSSDLRDVLLNESPGLSSNVLLAAGVVLTPGDLTAVLAAQ